MSLDHRAALVTGASKGIALALGRAGCNVAVNYFSDARGADDAVADLRNMGVEAFPVFANVGSASDVKEMFAAFEASELRRTSAISSFFLRRNKPLLLPGRQSGSMAPFSRNHAGHTTNIRTE